LDRSASSGYKTWSDDDAAEVSVNDFPAIERSHPRPQKSEVEVLETTRLRTEADEQYYNEVKPALKTDRDKRDFLLQKDRNSQRRWLASRGINESSLYAPGVREAIDDGDIMVGMPKEAVRKSWGDPEAVEVAGNPEYGVERWTYVDYQGSSEGYQKEERMVYFERGQVVGWETR
jgi:hypothetical protein